MNCMKKDAGSVAVECALVMPLMVALMMLVLHIGLLCVQKQNVIYATYMALRAQLIATDVTRAAQLPHGDNPVCDGGSPC